MSVNDQFKMARLPIRPESYEGRDLANTRELIIDNIRSDGTEPSFHLYITDYKDPTKLIDLTKMTVQEAQDLQYINGDKIKVTIEGLVDPQDLSYIINYIYKRFLMPDNKNGFVYDRDKDKIFDRNTKSILMKDTDNIIYLPITKTSNVYSEDGYTLDEIIGGLSRVGFASESVYVSSNTTSITINLPFMDYISSGNLIQIYIGGTYIVPDRYSIDENSNNTSATVVFTSAIERGRTVQVQYIYNKSITSSGKATDSIDGNDIINGSIPTSKLKEVSDNYKLDNSSYIATTKALTDLYDWVVYAIRTLQGGGNVPLDPNTNKIGTNRYVYTSTRDNETTIIYSALGASGNQVFVYRNGVRLFEGIDYTNNVSGNYITLYVGTERNERFVFECLYIKG